MLDDSIAHAHFYDVLIKAAQLLSEYFQNPIHFSKIPQLRVPDRRNIILRF